MHVRATSRATPSSCDGGEGEAQFPHGTWTHCEQHPAWNLQCTQWFSAEEFPLLCLTPKVMPRCSLGDVGEERWPLSHRWTDTSPILPDAAHDSRNQGRVVSLSVLSPLLACVRLCQLATGSPQLAGRAEESLVTDAECSSNRRVTCLLHIISDVTRVRHGQGTTLSILRAFNACAAAVQTAVLVMFGPSCLGHYRPLLRRSASDKCSVRCGPIEQRDQIYRNF